MARLQLSEVDLMQLVYNVSEPLWQMAEIRGLQFDVDLPEGRFLYWVDEGKIASAVQNLLSNAFKYTPSGGRVLLSVSHLMKSGQGYCRITVSDAGAGIPKRLQRYAFESFVTGDNVPEMSTKTGTGLYIVESTMDLHHSLVTLKSVPDEGSTSTLYIPEGRAHFVRDSYEPIDNCQEKTEQNEELKPESFLSITEDKTWEVVAKKDLLIIEDNESVREYIQSLFISRYVVSEACNGEEGVRIAKEQLPDLIISNVMMPVKDGFACYREIRM